MSSAEPQTTGAVPCTSLDPAAPFAENSPDDYNQVKVKERLGYVRNTAKKECSTLVIDIPSAI